MTAPIVLPSGKVLPARTAASAQRDLDAKAELREGVGLSRVLERLPSCLAAEFRLLRGESAVTGQANPRGWSDASAWMAARSILEAEAACREAGISIRSVKDLTSPDAVAAIIQRYTTPAGSGQNASRILRSVRPLIRRMGCTIPSHMRKAICALSRTQRRDEEEELPSAAECLDAAVAEFTAAMFMIDSGRVRRGTTRLRDAVIMAVDIATNFRRGEFAAIAVELITDFDWRSEIRITIPGTASKVRQVQLGVIRDERVINMLRRLMKGAKTGSLFQSNCNTPLKSVSVYKALRRTTRRSCLGVDLNFTKMRRVRVSGETSIKAMRGVARHTNGSTVAERTYSWHPDDIKIDECRHILRQYGLPSLPQEDL